ncbi:DUF418 domain-containing protein [Streptomyces lavendulae]|uniref:DUF418 domain-containing protein n=1 Tax=Streptomyces lavendulae TaxID=1914 RepID=UPI0024A3F11F|nr:DUF418 domain-containing protein [Streptomyces lavendulae]GLX20869.1 hypothetical protein Slala01_45130 [Streptomyces lavendulae subsp. lavendulae]GLX31888.1 hypothetical protein Slala02_77070 [Streptomyces lavendulae subsp. lavendulae]
MADTLVTPRADTTAARLPLLDVLRGAAILGTLMTNVWIFASPGSEWSVLQGGLSLPDPLADPSAATIAETAFRFLADGKFLSLLTILFGVGLAIQYDSAARRGEPWPGRYPRRAAFLFLEGTVHFVLIFAWDVLMGYAVTALLVAWLLARSERVRRVALWVAAGVHLTLVSLVTLGDAVTPDSPKTADPEAVRLYADGSWAEQIGFRLDNALALRIEPVFTFGMLVFLFLLGVRLHRAGAFGPTASGRRIRGRMAAWGLGLGLPLGIAAELGGPDFFVLGRYGIAPLVAVGYIGLIGWALDRFAVPGAAALGSVGRTALSCYVGQNLLCVLLCYGFGLGLAARFEGSGPWWVMGLWAAVSLVLVAGSRLWLRHFGRGPLEAVQHWALTPRR